MNVWCEKFLCLLTIDKRQRVDATEIAEDALERVGRVYRSNQQKVQDAWNESTGAGVLRTYTVPYLAIRILLVLVLVSEMLPSFA